MTLHDPERIAETVPLLRYAAVQAPQWIEFQTDDPGELKRCVYWLTHSPDSPLPTPAARYLIEWQLPGDGGWTRDVSATPLMGQYGRHGRFRFRVPRT